MLSTAELTFLHQNFTIAGGGTFAVRNVGGAGVYIRWSTRALVTPVCGQAKATYYNIECPTSGTIGTGTGQVNTSDGIFIGAPSNSYAALYYVLPTTQTADNLVTPPRFTYSSAPGNFRLINFQNSSENILPTYVLVAQIYPDTGHRQGAGDADVARPAVQLDLVRSPAQLLCIGVPRDRLILVGGGEHDVACSQFTTC